MASRPLASAAARTRPARQHRDVRLSELEPERARPVTRKWRRVFSGRVWRCTTKSEPKAPIPPTSSTSSSPWVILNLQNFATPSIGMRHSGDPSLAKCPTPPRQGPRPPPGLRPFENRPGHACEKRSTSGSLRSGCAHVSVLMLEGARALSGTRARRSVWGRTCPIGRLWVVASALVGLEVVGRRRARVRSCRGRTRATRARSRAPPRA